MHYLAGFVQSLMVERPGNLLLNVRNQIATQRNIDHLVTATNGQQRFVLGENFID